MAKPDSAAPRWFSSWRAGARDEPAADAADSDAADYGTAFGLDLSMAEGVPSVPSAPEGEPPSGDRRVGDRRRAERRRPAGSGNDAAT